MFYSYNYPRFSGEQVQHYLERIGLGDLTPQDRAPTPELLNKLIPAHQRSVPFENIDVFGGTMPSLDAEALYEKVVVRRRGGYCYELNGLFVTLLRSMGFNACSCLCRVMHGSDVVRPISHRGTLVFFGTQIFYCDVGFGGGMPAGALFLEEGGDQVIGGERYHVENRFNGWFDLLRLCRGSEDNFAPESEAGARLELVILRAAADYLDFNALNLATFSDTNGRFRTHYIVNLRTENGFRSLLDDTYREKENGAVTEQTITSEIQRTDLLREKFGIVL